MGEFMVCVESLVGSESCIVPVNGGVFNGGLGGGASPGEGEGGGAAVVVGCPGNSKRSLRGKKKGKEVRGREVVEMECRICQEEGEEADLETPCACNGTLKFAHRKCIQRWCDKKGNITCEICNQAFGPNYTVLPSRPSSDVLALDISREDWDTLIDLRDPHFLAIAAAQQDLLNEYEDYAAENANGIACCRVITLVLMLLLLLRHIFVVMKNIEMVQDISALFNIILEFVGFFLPCYVIARSCYRIPNWRR